MTQPVKKFRAGQVNCALWENELTVNGRTVTKLSATLERRYKDKNEQWKSSNSLGRNEIPLAIYCLEKAFEVGDSQLIVLKVHPQWDRLRSEPRFVSLLEKLHFPT